MILDWSAIVAIFFREPGYQILLAKLAGVEGAGIGAPTIVECVIVLTARMNRDARGMLARFLREADITVVPFTEAHVGIALEA